MSEYESKGDLLRAHKEEWKREQRRLKQMLIIEDVFDWSLDENSERPPLRYIGGVDISFIKQEGANQDLDVDACAIFVVLSYPALEVIYQESEMIKLELPYIAGYLAFREAPALIKLIENLRNTQPEIMPQVILVDGNGILHHRGFGLASQLGVLLDIPTIGVAKTLLAVDGLNVKAVGKQAREHNRKGGDSMELVGQSGRVWGAALRATEDSIKPLFISPGHKISLSTALQVVKLCCRFYRIPAPVREADLRSRAFIRRNYPDAAVL